MSKENFLRFLFLLPNFDEIQPYVQGEDEAGYIFKTAIENLQEFKKLDGESWKEEGRTWTNAEESRFLVESLVNKCWERIHTGHFSEVPIEIRKIYALANYFKILYMLLESLDFRQIEKCSTTLDEAMLIGCTQNLYGKSHELEIELTKFFDEILEHEYRNGPRLPVLDPLPRETTPPANCDVPILDAPSLLEFQEKCWKPQQPALLLNVISHWPALEKWRDLNYLLKVAGNRTVPIEIGSNYTKNEWSQQMMKIRAFLLRQFGVGDSSISQKHEEVEYLAQHELFDQIPALKSDICIPDYCTLGEKDDVNIKAWLGPRNTISPMHYDPSHNLLCQVFGSKQIILASPADTENLYPHESEFLGNTSQIDAENLDFQKFPLTAKVKFYRLKLQEGDSLYIPPKWWHYVRAETESFSVSFWWQ